MRRVSDSIRLATIALAVTVLFAACLLGAVDVVRLAPGGSIAAPSTELVDLSIAPVHARVGSVALGKLAGWFAGVACAAVLLGAPPHVANSAGAQLPGVTKRFAPLRI